MTAGHGPRWWWRVGHINRIRIIPHRPTISVNCPKLEIRSCTLDLVRASLDLADQATLPPRAIARVRVIRDRFEANLGHKRPRSALGWVNLDVDVCRQVRGRIARRADRAKLIATLGIRLEVSKNACVFRLPESPERCQAHLRVPALSLSGRRTRLPLPPADDRRRG